MLSNATDVQHISHDYNTVKVEDTTGHLPAGDGSADAKGDKVLSLLQRDVRIDKQMETFCFDPQVIKLTRQRLCQE